MKSHWYYCPIFSECCHQEIDKVLHDNELVTYEVRSQMPYMQVCMKEKKKRFAPLLPQSLLAFGKKVSEIIIMLKILFLLFN